MPAEDRTVTQDLLKALRAMPCYGCSTQPGDTSPDALARSRGCVTCRPARAAIEKAEGATASAAAE